MKQLRVCLLGFPFMVYDRIRLVLSIYGDCNVRFECWLVSNIVLYCIIGTNADQSTSHLSKIRMIIKGDPDVNVCYHYAAAVPSIFHIKSYHYIWIQHCIDSKWIVGSILSPNQSTFLRLFRLPSCLPMLTFRLSPITLHCSPSTRMYHLSLERPLKFYC